jgi:hypothetical protein
MKLLGIALTLTGVSCLLYLGLGLLKHAIYWGVGSVAGGLRPILHEADRARERVSAFSRECSHDFNFRKFAFGTVLMAFALYFTLADLPLGVVTWQSLLPEEGAHVSLFGLALTFDARMLALTVLLLCSFFGCLAGELLGATDFMGWTSISWKKRGWYLGFCLAMILSLCVLQADLASKRLEVMNSGSAAAPVAENTDFGTLGATHQTGIPQETKDASSSDSQDHMKPFIDSGQRAATWFAVALPVAAAVAGIGIHPFVIGVTLFVVAVGIRFPLWTLAMVLRIVLSILEGLSPTLQHLTEVLAMPGHMLCGNFIPLPKLQELWEQMETLSNGGRPASPPILQGNATTGMGKDKLQDSTRNETRDNGAGGQDQQPSPEAAAEDCERDEMIDQQQQVIINQQARLDELERERMHRRATAQDDPLGFNVPGKDKTEG